MGKKNKLAANLFVSGNVLFKSAHRERFFDG